MTAPNSICGLNHKMIDFIAKQIIITSINIHRGIPCMVYCGYEIAIILRYIEGIAFYRISRTRVTRLCVCVYNVYTMCIQYKNIVGGGGLLCYK